MNFLYKEVLIEFRNPKSLSTILGLTLILGIFVALGLNRAQVSNIPRIFPGVWLSILSFVLFIGIERLYDADRKNRALDALVLFHKKEPIDIFISKIIICSTYGTFSGILLFVTLFTFCGIDPPLSLSNSVIISALFSIGVSSVGVTLANMTSQTLGRFILIPILGVPIISPLFFGLIEAYFGFTIYSDTSWIWFCVFLNIIYITLSSVLFRKSF